MTDFQAMIMAQEGTGPRQQGRFLPYEDTRGKVTIAWGRNLTDKGLSESEALMLLNGDLADAVEDARHVCSVYEQLSRPRQLVLASMAFNLGRARLDRFVHFLGAIHRSAWDEAADEILNSQAAKQDAPVRYRQLAEMMRTDHSEWV